MTWQAVNVIVLMLIRRAPGRLQAFPLALAVRRSHTEAKAHAACTRRWRAGGRRQVDVQQRVANRASRAQPAPMQFCSELALSRTNSKRIGAPAILRTTHRRRSPVRESNSSSATLHSHAAPCAQSTSLKKLFSMGRTLSLASVLSAVLRSARIYIVDMMVAVLSYAGAGR